LLIFDCAEFAVSSSMIQPIENQKTAIENSLIPLAKPQLDPAARRATPAISR
jgi:hypothetical protein